MKFRILTKKFHLFHDQNELTEKCIISTYIYLRTTKIKGEWAVVVGYNLFDYGGFVSFARVSPNTKTWKEFAK